MPRPDSSSTFPRSPAFTRLALLALLTLPGLAAAQPPEGPRGYYRFPDVHGDTVVFTAEGDLWTVGIDGGGARRLTTHPGEETHPAVSPDGTTVAFSAAYEGPTEVYTMPLAGGLPERRTWEAESSIAVGWTPGGELVYTTQHFSTLPDPRLVRLDPATGTRRQIPLNQASDGTWDPAGTTLVFVRPGFHRNNTKRYQGGTARDLWRFADGDAEAANLTGDFPGEDHSPVWLGGRIYWINDRDGTMNVWSMAADGSDRRQETHHAGWDVRSLAGHGEHLVYRLGADLWRLDPATGRNEPIPITLASDLDQLREKWVQKPLDDLTAFAIDPKGERVVLTARGRVFTFPVKQGRRVRLARQPGVRYRDAVFMPGGDEVLLLSDASGEVELTVLPADGTGGGRALTGDGAILRFHPMPSPDGRWIAYTDRNRDLWRLEVETGRQVRLNELPEGLLREGLGEMSWSPDGRWLAFVATARNTYDQIYLHDTESGTTTAVTGDRVNSGSPVWSPDGEWLTFLSDRNLESLVGHPWGPRQPEPYFDRPMEIYQLALKKGLRPPFRPRDELAPEEDDEKRGESEGAEKEAEKEKDTEPVRVEIDLDGLPGRLWKVPAPPGNYRALAAGEGVLYFLARDSGPDAKSHLLRLEIGPEADEPEVVVPEVEDYRMSLDRKKLLLRREDGLYVIDAEPSRGRGNGGRGGRRRSGGGGDGREGDNGSGKLAESRVDLSGWTFPIAVAEDFRQLFLDAWRLERDYFYDPGMHGVDWVAVREKYLPLVERVTTREELSDLVGEVVGELSALHVSVRGGDMREGPEEIEVASLGARLVRDPAAGGDRIERIWRPDPSYPEWRSPLADPYLGIAEGDVIVAINGTQVLSVPDAGVLLRHQQERQVLLEIQPAEGGETRQVIVVPTTREWELRYRHWEEERRQRVEELGAGQIGYLHLKAMTGRDLADWYRGFYPVFKRRGLILDVRHNRGGNIDSILLEKLLRRAWFYWKARVGEPYWNMQYAFRGHLVVLCDEYTASDGEAFTEGFRRLGLGEVIGTRTWGGEIWLSNDNRLSDGGLARAPQTGVYGPEREWLIEGWGVEPDIVVDNLPHETFLGRDAQLEAAVEVLLERIEQDPRDVPEPPPYPDKSFPGP
jgi:tricorn protease